MVTVTTRIGFAVAPGITESNDPILYFFIMFKVFIIQQTVSSSRAETATSTSTGPGRFSVIAD